MKRLGVLAAVLVAAGWSCSVNQPSTVPAANLPVQLAQTAPIANASRQSVVYVEVLENQFTVMELNIATAQREPLFDVSSEPQQIEVAPDGSYLVERDADALRFYRFSDHAVERLHEVGTTKVMLAPSGRSITYTIVDANTNDERSLTRDVTSNGEVGEAYSTITESNVNL